MMEADAVHLLIVVVHLNDHSKKKRINHKTIFLPIGATKPVFLNDPDHFIFNKKIS